jgi:hypothetical protein
MKNKAMMKARAPQRKPLNQWPRFFRNMLEQLDVAGDDPVFLAKDDIAPEDQSYIASLMAQGLLSEEPSNSITCIFCDAIAAVRRKGEKGEKASAVCPCCVTIFQTNSKELRRWRADWNSLGAWVKVMTGADGEMESVSPSALFLGDLTKGRDRFEVYLARSLSEPTLAQQAYCAISQSLNGSGIVVSLTGNFSKPTNPKMVVISLADCLVVSGEAFVFEWPERAFSGKDQAKQRAGLARAQNDPSQKQKESLKTFVRSKITSIFERKYHHLIADQIIENHADQITYTDRSGLAQQLSRGMVLDAIKEVMRENGLEDWISGKKFNI